MNDRILEYFSGASRKQDSAPAAWPRNRKGWVIGPVGAVIFVLAILIVARAF